MQLRSERYKITTVLLVMCLLLTNCRKEKSYWDADFVAPLAHGNLALSNLFPDTTLKSNADSTLKIAFEASLINFGLDSLLKIKDTTITTTAINNVISFTFSPGMQLFSSAQSTYYDFPNGIKLSRAIIKYGQVKVELTNTARQPLEYHYQLLSAKKNNVFLDTVFKIPKAIYNGTVLTSVGTNSCYINLSGYDIDFTGLTHNTNNTIDQNGVVSISPLAQVDTLFVNQGLVSKFTFTGMVPQYALGYFGNQTISVGPDTTSFSIFNTIKSGMLNLNSALVNLRIINEFGVPMRATINSISSISTANQQTVTLNSSALISPINVNAAVNNGQYAPITASTKTITLNSATNTPNLTQFLGILPDKIAYKVSAQINPYGNTSLGNDFGYYGTAFKAYLDADIPLYFSASNLVLTDTIALNLSSIAQLKNINHGQLILTATNTYPFAINLQGYLLDENKHVLDVLFDTPNTIQAPALDANFKVIAPLKSKLTIPLNPTRIETLQKAKYVCYKSTFNTASQPNQIKFYNYYNLDLLLTADINYSIGK